MVGCYNDKKGTGKHTVTAVINAKNLRASFSVLLASILKNSAAYGAKWRVVSGMVWHVGKVRAGLRQSRLKVKFLLWKICIFANRFEMIVFSLANSLKHGPNWQILTFCGHWIPGEGVQAIPHCQGPGGYNQQWGGEGRQTLEIFCVYYGQTRRTWPGTRGRNRRGGGTGGCTATRSILDLSLGLGVWSDIFM